MQLGAYRCTECKKIYQTESGLARHIKVNHQQTGWRYRIIDKDFFFFFSKVKRSVSENLCHNDSIRNAARNYDFESCDKLLENVSGLYMRLQKSNDHDAFYSSFTSLISSNAEIFFKRLDHFTATLVAMNLARQILQEFLKQKNKAPLILKKLCS